MADFSISVNIFPTISSSDQLVESNPLFSWLHRKASYSLSCSSSFSTLNFQFHFVQLNTDKKCTPQIFSLVSGKLHEYFNMSWEKILHYRT